MVLEWHEAIRLAENTLTDEWQPFEVFAKLGITWTQMEFLVDRGKADMLTKSIFHYVQSPTGAGSSFRIGHGYSTYAQYTADGELIESKTISHQLDLKMRLLRNERNYIGDDAWTNHEELKDFHIPVTAIPYLKYKDK